MGFSRRGFLGGILLTAGVAGLAYTSKPLLLNPCLNPEMQGDSWLASIWQGLDPARVWDCHTHLAGTGDSFSGIHISKRLRSLLHPVLYGQRLFYMNAGCVSINSKTVDEDYAHRLALLARAMPAGVKTMLFAFDWLHDDNGAPDTQLSTFYIPDDYARQTAEKYSDVFEWVASIHPYRTDAIDQLQKAAAQGARAVKWLPAAQNIDPASKRCDAFFAELARLRLPLIIHCGEERAVQGVRLTALGNPLRLRRALEAGARIVVAHCASHGTDEDLDNPQTTRTSFELFTRLMDRPEWAQNLFADISATVLRNRKPEILKTLLMRKDWHTRLLNGSDYPLPGILPLISLHKLVRHGLLSTEDAASLQKLRQHNALHFDLALKRCLRWQGNSFPAGVFETRSFFENDVSY